MKNNKKICIVTRALINGGAERVIAQLANYFVKNGIECSIITIDVAAVAYELDTRINVDAIGKKADNKVKDRFFRYAALRKKIMRYKPDVVLSMPEDIGIYVILALIGSKIPVCVSERNNPWVMPDVKITRLLWQNLIFRKIFRKRESCSLIQLILQEFQNHIREYDKTCLLQWGVLKDRKISQCLLRLSQYFIRGKRTSSWLFMEKDENVLI